VVLPSAIEANMYAVASQSVQSTTVFLLLAFHLAGAMPHQRTSRGSLVACVLAAFIGNAIQENLMFAYVVLPAALKHVSYPISTWNAIRIRKVLDYTAGIAMAIVAYGTITVLLRTEPTKAIILNLTTVISFPAYQYTNLIPFEFWSHFDLVALVLTHKSAVIASVSALLLAVAIPMTIADLAAAGEGDAGAETRGREWRLLQSTLAIWIAAGSIYVLAGGYSFESRKKYVTLMLLSIVIAYPVSWLAQSARSWRRCAIPLTVAALLVSAVTTWMLSSLWILESRRGAALVDAIHQRPEITAPHIVFEPDIYQSWPAWRDLSSSQHNAAWVTELEVQRRYNREIRVVPAGDPDADAEISCRYTYTAIAECVVRPAN
jgi:hypothetical protein